MESHYRSDLSRTDCPAIMKQPETALPRIVPLSESALTIEFGETIDPHTNESVLAFATAVERAGLPGILDLPFRHGLFRSVPYRRGHDDRAFPCLDDGNEHNPATCPHDSYHSRVVWR